MFREKKAYFRKIVSHFKRFEYGEIYNFVTWWEKNTSLIVTKLKSKGLQDIISHTDRIYTLRTRKTINIWRQFMRKGKTIRMTRWWWKLRLYCWWKSHWESYFSSYGWEETCLNSFCFLSNREVWINFQLICSYPVYILRRSLVCPCRL